MRKLNIGPEGKYSAEEWWGAGQERLCRGLAPTLFQDLCTRGARGVWVTRHEWLRFLAWAKTLNGWSNGSEFAVGVRWST
jgi:hypothetical protein